jgi:F-type H+-transporting ATPase subunit gamma
MPTLKELKTRIASVKSTQQITRAMKLVAAAKMKKAIDAALASRPYSDEVTAVLRSLVARIDTSGHPLLEAHDNVTRVAVVVLSADRGLCGSFNNGLFRNLEGFLTERRRDSEAWEDAEFISFGKRGRDWIGRRDGRMSRAVVDMKPADFSDHVAKLVSDLTHRYEAGELDEVWLVYNRFVSTLRQDPTIEKLFPLSQLTEDGGEEPEHLVDFVYEPSQQVILNDVLPLFLRTRITQVFLESEAGEHAARMTAMDSATRNAKDVIDSLSTQFNRARQAAITRELVEIVAGAEAL